MSNKTTAFLVLAPLFLGASLYANEDEFISKETAILAKKIIVLPSMTIVYHLLCVILWLKKLLKGMKKMKITINRC